MCGGLKLKKYNNQSNVIGDLIYKCRKNKNLSKVEVSRQLQLHAVYLDSTELKRIETEKMIVKDFELIGLCKVLGIDFNELKDLIE